MAYIWQWDAFTAAKIAERAVGYETSEADWIDAFQYLIDCNVVWSLEPYFGRTAAWLIEHRYCKPKQAALRS